MKTKNIFKALVLAAVLVSACSKNDIADDFKGYTLPVTINVTRQGDAATTRATYDGESKKLSFSTGDKLFVEGQDNKTAGSFKGVLTWVSGGTFSGSINTKNKYTGTADALLTDAAYVTATLLPAGYESYAFLSIEDETDCSGWIGMDLSKAFAPTKKAAVEQFSYERATSYSSGFALSPDNAIVSFTISGLAAKTEVAVLFEAYGSGATPVNVTTDASGVATFAVAVNNNDYIDYYTLTVDGNAIALPDKTAEAGHIYNISRNAIPGALIGQFSVSSTKKVYFSKGNLQATYNGSDWSWAFAEHQWDYIGNAAGNTKVTATSPFISENATVDLFGWVGASSTWTGVNKYGITSSSATNNTNGYGNVASETLKSDWGTLIGSGWRTLSMDEWTYLLKTRTVNGGTGENKSYTLNQSVNGKKGMVIYPDNYTGAVYSGSNWASFEAAGCVFLPAAGWREGTTIQNINDRGFYWSSTPANTTDAKSMFFAGGLDLSGTYWRNFGFSVRLVREVK